mmetsp:Transcript_14353/g.39377  ORF Transcript_14353/g.39377 Transcript_14353/m.39377 type:complete len:235 (-) Transcript_14353:1031-1735(-)
MLAYVAVDSQEVLLARDAEVALRLVLVDKLGAEAEDGVGVEEGAGDALPALPVALLGGRQVLQPEARHGVDEHERVQRHVEREGSGTEGDELLAGEAVPAVLAVGLEHRAGQQQAAGQREHPLRPPVDVHVRKVEGLHAAKGAELVVGIDEDVGEHQRSEGLRSVPPGEEEGGDGEDHVEEDVAVAREVHARALEAGLREGAVEAEVGADDEPCDLVWQEHGEDGLKDKGEQES